MNKLCLLTGILLISCQPERDWNFSHKIELPQSIRPLGLVMTESGLWISDPDHNKILRVDEAGKVLQEINGFHRPMHFDRSGKKLIIPNFFNDEISTYEDGNIASFIIAATFDAPSSVSVLNDLIAFSDFYNHRILLLKGGTVFQISKEGRTDGLLFYPTDVKLYKDKVVVADAYNNRAQVFDQHGNFLKVIGWQEDIQVAAGLDVFEDRIFVTDYYGNRILVYDFEGILIKIIEGNFNKPTDILVQSDRFLVSNYGENTVTVYKAK